MQRSGEGNMKKRRSVVYFNCVVSFPCLCTGSVVEAEVASANYHENAAGFGASSGENLHRQVSSLFTLLANGRARV